MIKIFAGSVVCLFATVNIASACSPPFMVPYDPVKPNRTVEARDIPKPILSALEVIRGKKGDGFSCDDAGQLNFTVSLPPGSSFTPSDFGLQMTLIEGDDPYGIIDSEPIELWTIDTGSAPISLWWLDGARANHKPINMRIELRLVSGNAFGPATQIKVVSEP